jgi:hypothetical protein
MSMSEVMLKLRQIEQDILATGKVDGAEMARLRWELYGPSRSCGEREHDRLKGTAGIRSTPACRPVESDLDSLPPNQFNHTHSLED